MIAWKFTFGWYQGWIWRVDDRYWLLAMNIILISLFTSTYLFLRRCFKVDLWNRPKAWWPTFLRWCHGRGYPRDLDLKPRFVWNKPIDRRFLQTSIGYVMCCIVLVLYTTILPADFSWVVILVFKSWPDTVTISSHLMRWSSIQYRLFYKIHYSTACTICVT